MVCETSPTCTLKSMRVLCPTSTRTSGRLTRLKPVFSTSKRYLPGFRLTNEYRPSLPVGCECFSPVRRFVKVTCASETAAPEVSVTAPEIDPYEVWADTGGLTTRLAAREHIASTKNQKHDFFMLSAPNHEIREVLDTFGGEIHTHARFAIEIRPRDTSPRRFYRLINCYEGGEESVPT